MGVLFCIPAFIYSVKGRENKKYYFLKLKEDFFDQRKIVVLKGSKERPFQV